MKKLSIIIVTYNSEPDIYRCLESVFSCNDTGDDLEVIIVDNNSQNFEQMRCKISSKYGEKVKILCNSINGGYGQGNNIGIRHSTAPIIMIVNPDVRLINVSFKTIIKQYEQDDNLAILGFKQICNESGKKGTSFSLLNHYSGTLRFFAGIISQKLDIFYWRWMYFCGACFCIRKAMFEHAGLFDENIFLYGEENDIHYRIHKTFPNAHDKYHRKFRYIHPTENRPYSEESYQLRIKSNEYVMKKQGRANNTYIKSEKQRLNWSRRIFGNA